MKTFLLLLCMGLMVPQLGMGQYYFGAQVSSFDDCCIAIEAGPKEGDNSANWSVVVDGNTYVNGDQNFYGDILHCPETNGVYTVEFYVNGELYWTDTVVVNCQNEECEECKIQAPKIDVGIKECKAVFCAHGESSMCENATYEWDFGDGNTSNDYWAIHDYAENGTYTACLTYTVTNSNGDLCSEVVCEEITITDCESCCGFDLNFGKVLISPFDPCTAFINVNASASPDCEYELWFDYDNDGTKDGTSPFHTFTTPGPHTVCATLISEDCELTECSDPFELPGCGEPEGCTYNIGEPNNSCGAAMSGTTWPVNANGNSIVGCVEPFDRDFYQLSVAGKTFYVQVRGAPFNTEFGDYLLEMTLVNGDILDLTVAPWTLNGQGANTKIKVYNSDCVSIAGNGVTGQNTTHITVDLNVWKTSPYFEAANVLEYGANIYPNPANDFFTISFNEIQENTRAMLYDVSGKMITEIVLTNANQQRVDVSNYPPGLYMVEIQSANGIVIQKVLID